MAFQTDQYIGDGVYVSFDGYQIWLAANHPSNKVVALEPAVFRQLVEYEKRLGKHIREIMQARQQETPEGSS